MVAGNKKKSVVAGSKQSLQPTTSGAKRKSATSTLRQSSSTNSAKKATPSSKGSSRSLQKKQSSNSGPKQQKSPSPNLSARRSSGQGISPTGSLASRPRGLAASSSGLQTRNKALTSRWPDNPVQSGYLQNSKYLTPLQHRIQDLKSKLQKNVLDNSASRSAPLSGIQQQLLQCLEKMEAIMRGDSSNVADLDAYMMALGGTVPGNRRNSDPAAQCLDIIQRKLELHLEQMCGTLRTYLRDTSTKLRNYLLDVDGRVERLLGEANQSLYSTLNLVS